MGDFPTEESIEGAVSLAAKTEAVKIMVAIQPPAPTTRCKRNINPSLRAIFLIIGKVS